MTNIGALKIEYFESFANEIISKFGRLQNIIKHNTATGDYHEELLRTILRNFLSKRFSVKKGFIYASSEKISKQIDLIIVDENSPAAYIFQEGDFAVVLPQAVVAVIEIKTYLKSDGFVHAVENIASAKSLMEFPASLTGIIFGYGSTDPTDENLDKWFKKQERYKDIADIIPNAVMFFGKSVLLVCGDDKAQIGICGKHYYKVIGGNNEIKPGMDSKALQMSLIIAMIINACEQKEFRVSHIFPDRVGFSLVNKERSALILQRFAFGEGKSDFVVQ